MASITVREPEDSPKRSIWGKLDPLPEEEFPRVFEKREPGTDYYVALGLVMSVWMITPLSCAYLLWYILIGQGLGAYRGLTSTIFAAYALTEAVFAIYTSYLIRWVQAPGPPSTLPIETRNELFRRVLNSDLSYPLPRRPSISDDPDKQMDYELYKLYESGHLTLAQYHHAKDKRYEEMYGMQSRRRVGKMSEREKEVIEAFVEEEPGEREQRLRDQIEKDVGWAQRGMEDEQIINLEGKTVPLHPMDRRAVEFRERLRTWFNHAPWESIRRENALIWLSWSCFNVSYEEVKRNDKWHDFLLSSLELWEARTGTVFPPGLNPDIEMMRITMDPVNAKGRPLILYAVSNLINWWLREIVYPYQGMGLYREDNIDYLVRVPEGWTPEKGKTQANAMPIVYFHGVGFGLMQSHLLIKHLIESLPTHPLLIPLSPHTSQSIFHEHHLRPWNRVQLVPTIKSICKKWGFWEEASDDSPDKWGRGGVSMMSHSNGSVAHGWILKDCPQMTRRNTFVDPVVFCLWEGDICHSFCYRKPVTALELLLFYFIASEVGIANYIQRHWDWADNNLWFDEIPNATDSTKTTFFLGAQDIIIDAARTRRYLERHGAGSCIHWDPKAGHGDGLSGDSRDRVVMFVGTGSTQGWEGWIPHIRRKHSLGMDDFTDWAASRDQKVSVELGRRESQESVKSQDSEETFVEGDSSKS